MKLLASRPSRGDEEQLEAVLARFDQAWQAGPPPRIEDFLPPAPSPARRTLLAELVAIDLEYRWRPATSGGARSRPRLEQYVARFPELGPLGRLPLELIGEEYRVRQHWGDRPGHAEYATRFAGHGPALRETLRQIDAELSAEFRSAQPGFLPLAPPAPAPRPPGLPEPVPAVASGPAFLEALRQSQVLSAARLEELTRSPAAPRALARELLSRGWLTPYQVNQLFLGRGQDLVLGPYVLLERLGEGGTGQVFKARHQRMNRVVALKLIRKDLLTDAEVVGRFLREIEAVGQLSHPNVVHAYDAGPVGGSYFLAMEYVDGIDLARLVKQQGPLPVAQACDYVRQAALGLQHGHEHGLVHRDIKPSNLLVTGEGCLLMREGSLSTSPIIRHSSPATIKILDLGLSRLRRIGEGEATVVLVEGQSTSQLTPVGAVMMGTPDYLAPEQALDFHRADIRADIYSLGCTLYYLLTGRPPFAGGTLAQKLLRHQQAEPPSVEQFRSDLPPGVARVLRRMLAKRPEDRYQTPAEVAQALAGVGGLPAAAEAVRWAEPQSWTARRRRRIAAGALLLGGLILLLVLLARPQSGPDGRKTANAPLPLAQLWASGRVQATLSLSEQPIVCVAVSRDGRTVAAGTGKGEGWLWDRTTGKELARFRTHPVGDYGLSSLAISPDGTTLATGSEAPETPVKLWSTATGKEQAAFGGRFSLVHCLAFSPDGRTLAVGGRGTELMLWDVPGNRERASFATGAAQIGGVAFAPDGRIVATAAWGGGVPGVKLWDATTGQEQPPLEGSSGEAQGVAFAPDGRSLAAVDRDGTLRVWNLGTRKLRPLRDDLRASAVAFALDSRTLALACPDRTVKLWDLVLGKEIVTLRGHGGPVLSLAFTADGRTLVSGGQDGTVRLWQAAAR